MILDGSWSWFCFGTLIYVPNNCSATSVPVINIVFAAGIFERETIHSWRNWGNYWGKSSINLQKFPIFFRCAKSRRALQVASGTITYSWPWFLHSCGLQPITVSGLWCKINGPFLPLSSIVAFPVFFSQKIGYNFLHVISIYMPCCNISFL